MLKIGVVIPDRSPSVESLQGNLRRRARNYRVESRLSLITILVSLLGGAVIFIFADSIAEISLEGQLRSVIDRLKSAEMMNVAVEKVVNKLTEYDDLIRGFKDVEKWPMSPPFSSEISDIISKIKKIKVPDDSSIAYRELIRELERNVRVSRSIVASGSEFSNIESSLQSIIDARAEDKAIETILSSLSTRLGSVFLVVFLVRILTTQFRYSTRMAAYHESRADIVSLGKLSKAETKELLSVDDIGFDKMPRAPTSDIRDILLKAIESIKVRP